MTATATAPTAPAGTGVGVRDVFPLRRQVRVAAGEWLRRHRASIALLLPLLALVGGVHARGMGGYPRWVDDPGTYLSQAWSLQYEQALSPYSYFYDHAPAGWIQLALWSTLTGGFDRHDSAIGFGNECMLIAKVVSAALLYVLARRIGTSRLGAAAAVLLFGLCPLELVYSRWTFLDNLVTPWLLLAFVLAYSPRRSIAAATGATLAFGTAALTKETALLLLPAFAWAFAQNLDRRNRAQVVTVAAFCGVLLMALYPLYALYKGELLEAPDRNTLLGTARWQLLERQGSGSFFDPGSATSATFAGWLAYDRVLLLAGAAAMPLAMLVRRLRPVSLALVIGWLALLRGGYLPFMHVLTLVPWAALVVVGVVERAAGNWRLSARRRPYGGWRGRAPGAVLRGVVAGLAVVALGTTVAGWVPSLQRMTGAQPEPPLRSATRWVADNIPRDRVLVVHDAIWTDLVHKHGFQPRPVIVYKLDTDPAVRASLDRIDYLVLPNWYFRTPDAATKYPTAVEARRHAVTVATFGSGDDGVTVHRVSARWRPG